MDKSMGNLFYSFYNSIPKEVGTFFQSKELYHGFCTSCETICTRSQDRIQRLAVVSELYKDFKVFERAAIAGSRCVFSHQISGFPVFFRDLYLQFLEEDGSWKSRVLFVLSTPGWDDTSSLPSLFFLLRQVCLAFSKAVDIGCEANDQVLIDGFRERLTRNFDVRLVSNYNKISDILFIARALIRAVFFDDQERLDPAITQFRDQPYGRHGPGAVADGSEGSGKWDYSPDDFTKELFVNHEELPTRTAADVVLPPSVATLVPKDPLKKRIICMEPKELQFGQQGASQVLIDIMQRSPFTRSSVNLTDQSRNFWLSRNYNYATIDLSDASDLIDIRLCRLLFPKEVFSFLTRYRSKAILLPDGTLINQYSAMATMGNALCFPVESIVFWSLALAAIISNELRIGTYRSAAEVNWVIRNNPTPLIKRFRLRVFGDDIIVPKIHFDAVMDVLEAVGMQPNASKSCCETPIRESCGSYWFSGFDTRVVRFKHTVCSNPLIGASLINQIKELLSCGMETTAEALARCASDALPSVMNDFVSNEAGIREGWLRWNTEYQRLERRVPVIKPEMSRLPGEIGLYAYFTRNAIVSAWPQSNAQRVTWGWEPTVR